MTNQLAELILHLSRMEGNLVATLLGPAGQVLASQPVTLNVAALRQMVGPEAYGRALTEAVLDGPLGQALPQARLARLRLVTAGQAGTVLHDLRWECLLRQTGGPPVPLATGPGTPFSRLLYPDSTTRARPPRTDWPLRIVVAISNPSNLAAFDLAPVAVDLERAEFQRALRPLQGLVEVEFIEPPVSLDRICQALEKEPDIFHFTGHGAFHSHTGGAALFLERGTERQVQIVRQDEWIRRLKTLPRPPHLMVLTACESAAHVKAGVLVGLAPALVEAGAGAVAAMRDKVGIDVAREFIYHFYRRLATHGQIDLAVNEARSYLLDRGGWSWSIPTLFLERGAERIFAAPPETLEADPAQPGEILILIPEFKGHEEAFFEVDLRDTLQTHVAEADLQHVRVVWLKQTAFGPGDEDAVRRLAARYGAALVLWGWYDRSRFRACFSVTESLFTYRDPLAFRSSASVRSLLQAEQDFALFVNQDLPRQVDYFVFFTLGQLYYQAGDYERALAALNQAIAAAQSEAGDDLLEGLAYAYFYRGNVHAVHRQDRPAAIADYRQALTLAPNFAGVAFNLGESLRILANTHRAHGDEETALKTYQAAIAAYGQAINIAPDYVLAYEGRGLAYYEIGSYEAAVADYRSALAHEPRAETCHQLGLALRNLKRWDEALAELERAIARAPGVGRYYFSRGRVYAWLGDENSAIVDFQTYLRLSPPTDAERRAKVKAWLTERGVSDFAVSR
jgi:tetratricopeptide (TPR) repeat protein